MAEVKFVVAYSENRVIGEGNQMPWHLPNDFKHFKALTLHHRVLMGRKTYESIGRPLPEREMIVLTRNTDFHSDYAKAIHSIDELFPLQKDLYVIGGAEIFQLMLADADVIYATEVKTHIKGDAFFPELSTQAWREVSRESHFKDEKHPFDYDFVEYRKV
jgi:dihydrofolate reductase